MYNNAHYANPGYQSGYAQYPQAYAATYGAYQGYAGYSSQNAQPVVPGQEMFTANNWSGNYNQADPKDAVAQEMQQQKAQLVRQREDYVKKASVLRHELEQLQMQKQDLVGSNRSTPDTDLANILKQNDKLQEEIQGKLKAIHNVIEMLSSIIKDNKSISDLESELADYGKPKIATPPTSTDNPYKVSSVESNKPLENFCYVHYDTGLHWCRLCDEFPETAKDFLLHLQDKKHREMAKENDVDSTPWHKLPQEVLMPCEENAPKKRIPIKGLQFFISAPSWYCKLCDVWIGDLHCASQHLKSKSHHQNYENFVSQNPHWEMEWLKDREKSMARKGVQDSSDSDSGKKRRKRKDKHSSADLFSLKDKKKKKKSRKKRKHSSDSSSSSSSSDSSSDDENEDRSRSIRVAMRNMKQVQSIMDEDLTAKWNVLEKLVEEHKKMEQREKDMPVEKETRDDHLINQWMTVSQPPPKEKVMLDSLKDRMRQKQEQERVRLAELDKHKREKEREEIERAERKKREEKQMAEEEERRRKIKEQEELERIRDKERNQVRFKTNSYRKKRSYSRSDEEDGKNDERYYKRDNRNFNHRHSRSRSRSASRRNSDKRHDKHDENDKKKPPGPPSYKKLPFIGRMPLFKNKPKTQDDRDEPKEIKKQSYETPRRTRFEPGNLPKAFIPKPDVVCFPKLSSIPPLTIPPPPPVVIDRVPVPEAPKISRNDPDKNLPKAPPPPKLRETESKPVANLSDDEVLYGSEDINPNTMDQYYQNYEGYGQNSYHYEQEEKMISPPPPPPHSHSMPLEPPPLPPDDDLALLGICADDMAAQSF
ncbi:unnamed protein product [Phyllotreta striolata]|uniref:U1-type domain-containing protein n=1 Tax=Phyllotreta striolata TaxID=444603 RepID=A0A9N9TLZ0_PHYSR|nr:unnamed protein product [Phyllotreta striolata]